MTFIIDLYLFSKISGIIYNLKILIWLFGKVRVTILVNYFNAWNFYMLTYSIELI